MFTSMWPPSLAISSAICLIMPRMNSGTVANRSLAAAVQGSRPCAIASAASAMPAAPPIPPIIWFLNCSSTPSVISAYPSSRAFFSASRRTIPRKNIGARSMRFIAPSVHRMSVASLSSESDAAMVFLCVPLLVEQFLELFSCFEKWNLFGGHSDRRTCFRVPSLFHAPRSEPEASESTDLGFVAVLQRVSDAIEDGIHDDLRLPLRERRHLLRNPLDDLRLGHVRFPFR